MLYYSAKKSLSIMKKPLIDTHGRTVNYLRLSVTDRCNLRCCYCSPKPEFLQHDKIMSFEEMGKIVQLFTEMGVTKLRLTGGEPFVRKGFSDFLQRLRAAHPKLLLRITTNGVLTFNYAKLLKELDVKVNMSLDTLQKDKFEQITGHNCFDDVMKSIHTLLNEGVPLKLNAVALKGINDDELTDFLSLAFHNRLDMRYIEFMPMGDGGMWNQNYVWNTSDILEKAQSMYELIPLQHNNDTDGPATMYTIKNGKGRFGLISPLSNHYCHTCNRLRVTSEGKLRTCLYDDKEYSFMPILREKNAPDKDARMLALIQQAIITKPIGAELLEKRTPCNAVSKRNMFSIGG